MSDIITIPLSKSKSKEIKQARRVESDRMASHFGMTVVDRNGNDIDVDPTKVQADRVNEIVHTIRQQLSTGAELVEVDNGYRDIYEAVCRELTKAERKKVHFRFFDLPRPAETKEAVIRGDEIWDALDAELTGRNVEKH